jgi:hypothetical protein
MKRAPHWAHVGRLESSFLPLGGSLDLLRNSASAYRVGDGLLLTGPLESATNELMRCKMRVCAVEMEPTLPRGAGWAGTAVAASASARSDWLALRWNILLRSWPWGAAAAGVAAVDGFVLAWYASSSFWRDRLRWRWKFRRRWAAPAFTRGCGRCGSLAEGLEAPDDGLPASNDASVAAMSFSTSGESLKADSDGL